MTIECRYEDWADLLGGREHPLKLAALRRLRPKGDLRWLWRARRMFPLARPSAGPARGTALRRSGRRSLIRAAGPSAPRPRYAR